MNCVSGELVEIEWSGKIFSVLSCFPLSYDVLSPELSAASRRIMEDKEPKFQQKNPSSVPQPQPGEHWKKNSHFFYRNLAY